jgi:diguanylate cyclase (GGDEF)-like protein
MRQLTPSLPPGQPDPVRLRRLFFIQRACLALVGLIAITALSGWIFPQLGDSLPAIVRHMNVALALTAIFCTLSLVMSEPGNPLLMLRLSRHVALLAGVIALGILIESIFHFSPALDTLLDEGQKVPNPGSIPLQPAAAFVFLAIVMVFVRSGSVLVRRAADVLVSCLCLLALILLSQDLFGALGLFGLTAADLISPQVLCCLILLTVVVALRQIEHGVFTIFVGCGIGSRIARGFAPILLVWPFLREVLTSRNIFQQMIPAHFAPAILTSLAAAFSLVFLIFLVWRINSMEHEIHDLTLRDELTGLYNMRGFYLLAEQTLRLAQRAQLPFSVLFIDLDGLKQINDLMGHNTGSAYLAETGELINHTFREGDVKGRFGGDEFVVAGQFSMVGIEIAAQRLASAAAERSANSGKKFPISFSIGHVTSEHYSQESLRDLVTRADEEMYKEKRRKKAEQKAAVREKVSVRLR